MSRLCTRSTYAPYFSVSSIVSHGLTAPSGEQPHALEPEVLVEVGDRHLRIGQRRRERVDGPVDAGGRVEQPRVVGESKTGGRNACNVRSPMSSVSPSMTHWQRSSGKSKQLV